MNPAESNCILETDSVPRAVLHQRISRFHTRRLTLVRPNPPKLSLHVQGLADIESAGIYSNYGPVNTELELAFLKTMFLHGECLTVCNATIGLLLAIRSVIDDDRPPTRKYALMPSFTFSAAAQAALWAGLVPLLCDIHPETWLPDAASESALMKQYAGQIAVIVPNATFGNNLDLARYHELSLREGIPIVVDAAASLGSLDQLGRAFGSGFPWPVVFSMHATKLFSVGEGGLIYSSDEQRIRTLRAMSCFGFEQPRCATLMGLNAKMSETTSLTALLQLRRFPEMVRRRLELTRWYARELSTGFALQVPCGKRQMRSLESVLLPSHLAPLRHKIRLDLEAAGIETATYFSPHLADQPLFQKHGRWGDLPVTRDVSSRILTLPMHEGMDENDVAYIAETLRAAVQQSH